MGYEMTFQSRMADIRAQDIWIEQFINAVLRRWPVTCELPARWFLPRVDLEEVLQ